MHSTIGVHQLIIQGGTLAFEPLVVPEGVVAALRACENADGVIDFRDELQPGGRVVISGRPLAELAGCLEDMPGRVTA